MDNTIFKILFWIPLEYDVVFLIELRISMKHSLIVFVFDLTHCVGRYIIDENGSVKNTGESFTPILFHSVKCNWVVFIIHVIKI